MEKIEIHDLRIRAFHGVLPAERRIGNLFSLDITLYCELSTAMESDNVNDTINYANVIHTVIDEMKIPSNLLEHVVGRIKKTIIKTFPKVTGGKITLSKLSPPIAGIEIGSVDVSTSW